MILQGRNLTQGVTGADVAALQSELSQLGYTVPAAETQATQFGAGTLAAVQQVQTAKGLAVNGVVDTTTADALTQLVKDSTFVVSGHVTSATSLALSGLKVQLVDKNVGGDIASGTPATTGIDGAYSISVVVGPPTLAARLKAKPDLQTQVVTVGANGASTVLAASAVAVDAVSPLTLNIALPAATPSLPSEYETLTAALRRRTSVRLKDLKETDTVQDITYLSVKSGWDARAVAMASLADQFSTITAPAPASAAPTAAATTPTAPTAPSTPPAPPATVSLQAEFYYALFRAGLPGDANVLYRTGATTVQAIWTQALAQNVIPAALKTAVPQAVTTFQTLAGAQRLTAPPKFGISTLQDLVGPTLTGTGQAQQFSALLTQHAGDWTNFWTDVGKAFGAATQQKLQLIGQLSYLTIDNASLIGALTAQGQPAIAAPIDLATQGYWDPKKWAPLIGASIPPGIAGATATDKAANYAQVLAAHVKLAFPTASFAGQIKAGNIHLTDTKGVGDEVSAFLAAQQAEFVLGVEPVDAYVARQKIQPPSKGAAFQLKRLHRVIQMTPNDTTMAAMLSANLDSAHAVVRYNQANFVRAFAAPLGGADAATGIYRRARQIHGAALNVAMSYANARNAPNWGGGSPVIGGIGPSAPGSTAAAATLETLFGSLDTCGCADCESILSPAAYLVDLLHYLDQPPPAGSSDSNPQTVLFGRRPDLQYLPLSCENTDVALPYIDIVNETLEAFVADGAGNFSEFQGFDTGDTATSAQLLAVPQNVNDAAYAKLQNSFFPTPLPFNRPLALLRQHMAALALSVPDAMQALRKDDSAAGGGLGNAGYGWNDILIERLQISRDEMRVFDDSTLTLGDLTGLPAASALTTLQQMSLHDLVRRFQITYDDIVAVLATQFVNPNASLIERVQRLGAPFTTIAALKQNPSTIGPDFIAALPANLDYSQYGGSGPQDVVNWLCDPTNFNNLMSLIVIANPTTGAIDCSGDQLQLRYANPDATKNMLSEIDWTKIVRFIRLWQKLQPALGGGDDPTTIQQTDALLSALFPGPNPPPTRVALDQGFATAITGAGFVFQAMELLSLSADPALPSVLACAGSIGLCGSPSFYQSLFLAPGLAQVDLGAQTATLSGPLFVGDTLQTTINGIEIDHIVAAGDTAGSAAKAIATAINTSTALDPPGPAIGKRFFAAANLATIVVSAGFQVTIPPGAGITETLTANAATPISQTITLGGTPTAGDVVALAIDQTPISVVVNPGDDLAAIAANLRDVINATAAPDAFAGQALNTLVAASSAGPVLTLVTAGSGAPFTLVCGVKSAAVGGYAVWTSPPPGTQGLRVTGTLPQGATLTTTINGATLYYTVGANEALTTTATNLANLINGSSAADPLTGLAVNSLVSAAPDSTVKSNLVLTAQNPTVGFTLAASISTTSYLAGRAPSPFADNRYGAYFADHSQTLLMHEPMLCAACNLTGTEFAQISQALGFTLQTPLDLGHVSALYRHGWLAHALGISVLEFLRLKACSGIDPFGPLDLGATPGQDPEPGLIIFIKMVQAMATASLDPAQALYLVWNEDISGSLAPDSDAIGALALQLRADFAAINATFARKADPDGSVAQALMALVYGAADTSLFFSLVDGTYLTTTPFAYAASALPQAAIDASGGRLSYDPVNKQLSFSGVIDAATQTAIKAALAVNTADSTDNFAASANATLTPVAMTNIVANAALLLDSGAAQETVVVGATSATTFTATLANAHNGTSAPFAILNDPGLPAAVDALTLANQQAVTPFFAQYPELQGIYASFAASTLSLPDRHTALLAQFLPILIAERKREQALSDVSAAIGQDTSFAGALLQDPRVLASRRGGSEPALDDFTAIETGGLSADYHLDGNPAGANPQTTDAVGPVQFAQVGQLSGPISAGVNLTTTINGVAVGYVTVATDTDLATIAAAVARQINSSGAIDPTTKLPIANLVSATSAASASGATAAVIVVSKSPADPSKATTFACASSDSHLAYTAGGVLASDIVAQLPAGVSAPLPQGTGGAAIAVVLSGYLVAPQDGAYNFSVVLDPGAAATVNFGPSGPVLAFGAGAAAALPVKLSAAVLTPIELVATGVKTTVTLCWQNGAGLGWQAVPAQYLYPQKSMDRLRDSYVRFLKAASLASALSLDADETAYLAFDPSKAVATTARDKTAVGAATFQPASMANVALGVQLVIDQGPQQETVTVTAVAAKTFSAVTAKTHDGSVTPFPIASALAPKVGMGWLNWLPGPPHPPGLPFQDALGAGYPDQALSSALNAILRAVLDFARLKQALSPSDERLMQTMQAPGTLQSNGLSALLGLTGWQPASLNALLLRFFGSMSINAISDVENFARVYDAMQIVKTSRVPAGTLLGALTNAPSPAGVAALQSALRAQYAEQDWLTVVKPIYDALRIAQRDALVAYILQNFKTNPPPAPFNGANTPDTPDKLFEFFLIDVQTQPAVETSRIRLALSTVQLFIERVLRGLEPQVAPSDIDPQQWSWMKRYRVWQANREVFLWPENWLYPELRDDQSPIYQTTASALLQGDITDDAATSAYLDYLTNLEEIAKLEPCGIHYVPATTGSGGSQSDEIAYVIARTAGAHRKHFFRQLVNGSWTPWEEVKVECEDMPLTPIVWDVPDGSGGFNQRLFLFWLKIFKQQQAAPAIGAIKPSQAISAWQDTDVTGYATSAASSAGQVNITAVLCWSEFYNGKWQSAKTSDPNRPASITWKTSAGDNSFEQNRNRFRLVVQPYREYVPSDCLVLAILAPNQGAGPDLPFGNGFVLHNTHSLPMLTSDVPADFGSLAGFAYIPAPLRYLQPQQPYYGTQGAGPFTVSRYDTLTDIVANKANSVSTILTFNWQPRFVEPQIGPGDDTCWPFLYEDRRNQFYVQVDKSWTLYNFYGGFGAAMASARGGFVYIPSLTIGETLPTRLPPSVDGIIDPTSGGDPAGWSVAGNRSASIGSLATGGAVQFQGRLIGATGSAPAQTVALATQTRGT